jgi:hypothetical protein
MKYDIFEAFSKISEAEAKEAEAKKLLLLNLLKII